MKEVKILIMMILTVFISCNKSARKEKELLEAEREMAHTKVMKMEKDMGTAISDIVSAWNEHNLNLMRNISVEEFNRFNNGKKEISSRSEYLSLMDSFHEGFSNIKVELTGEPAFSGNKSYTRFIFSGINTGTFMGNPPTDKEIEVHGFSIWTFNEHGQATMEEVYYDQGEFLMELGYALVPPENN